MADLFLQGLRETGRPTTIFPNAAPTPVNPVLQQIAQQLAQNPQLHAGDPILRQTLNPNMQSAINAGQIAPDELAMMNQLNYGERARQLASQGYTPSDRMLGPGPSGGYPARPVGAPTQIVPSGNGPFEAGPVGSTGVSPGSSLATRPTQIIDTTATEVPLASARAAAPAATAAGEAALASETALATESVESAAAKAAAAAQAGTAGSKMATALGGMSARLNTLVPGLNASITTGSLMSGLTVATLGLAAGGYLDRLNIGGEGSNLDIGLSSGVKGAAVGGGAAIALGLSSGPVGWAALGGAALFALTGILGHKSDEDKMKGMVKKANETIESLIGNPQFGVDAYTAQQIRSQFMAATSFYMGAKNKAGLEGYLQNLASTVPTFLLQASERNQAVQQRIQLQAAFGPVYANMMTRSAEANKLAFDTQMQAAGQISDPQISAALKSRASEQYANQQALQAAYAQQIAGKTTQLPAPAQAVQDQAQSLIQQMMAVPGR